MTEPTMRAREATRADVGRLIELWGQVFNDVDAATETTWEQHAREWFLRTVDDPSVARFPVVEVDGVVVAAAIGTLEIGVPNPYCPRGRTVRLANVITVPGHRGNGYASRLVCDVVDWARSIEADRVDLSATPEGRRIYDAAGFMLTSAPRMKLVL